VKTNPGTTFIPTYSAAVKNSHINGPDQAVTHY
jgi:hypothetical protein